MKEKKTYSKIYNHNGYQESYPKISKYIENNFIEGSITGSSFNSKQNYLTLDKDVLIKVTPDIGKMIDSENYRADITVEKVGLNGQKQSLIEKFLLNEGFKEEIN